MNISTKLDKIHFQVKQNRWFRYFAIFNRIALAAGFIPSGFVKIMGERFTSLAVSHPMGNYLEALSHTGYYYTSIGILQVTAAILLLIPRTATLGAVIYFPIILNICLLSLAVRFDGSLLSSPLMVLANLYLLCWDYDKLKLILPFNHPKIIHETPAPIASTNKFPTIFFTAVFLTVIILGLSIYNIYEIRPRNTIKECKEQCKDSKKSKACNELCDCIHKDGQPLDKCLDIYNKAPEDSVRIPYKN